MASSTALLLGLLVGIALGAVVGALLARTRGADEGCGHEDPAVVEARHAADLTQLRHDAQVQLSEVRHSAAAERAQVESSLASARAEVEKRLAAVAAEAKELREQVGSAQQQYRDAVERHRREEQKREASGAAESKVLQQLAPVAAQLRTMQQKVEEIEKQRSGQHSALAEQIRATQETAEKSKLAAEQLSSALRNNSVRGVYGEMQLTSIVESVGLINRVDYSTQTSITADSGARRPDMIINLPGGKQMAIDAKVPFSAFIDANDATRSDEDRKALAAQHAKQVKGHVDALSAKEYWTGLGSSPEFTVAFIPNDAILNVALDADPTLLEHAFAKGIVLATPVNLWATLKAVAFTWKQEDLAEHAQDVVDLGRTLMKRLGTLADHATKLGSSLDRTVSHYNRFVGSLERGVLVTARKLGSVDDASLIADVEELDHSQARGITASELVVDAQLDEPVEAPRAALASSETAVKPDAPEEQDLFADLERDELEVAMISPPEVDRGRDAG